MEGGKISVLVFGETQSFKVNQVESDNKIEQGLNVVTSNTELVILSEDDDD